MPTIEHPQLTHIYRQTRQAQFRLLLQLRFFFITCGILLTLILHSVIATRSWPFLASVWCIQIISTMGAWRRIAIKKTLNDNDIALQLATDILALGILFLILGHSTSPFVSLLMVPAILAGLLLRGTRFWGLFGFALGCTALTVIGPLLWPQRTIIVTQQTNLPHLLALAYVISTLITFLVSGYAIAYLMTQLRKEKKEISTLTKTIIREQELSNIGLLAIGSAHDMATPLNTMLLTIDNWPEPQNVTPLLEKMRRQILRCQKAIDEWLGAARAFRLDAMHAISATDFFESVLSDWHHHHPHITLTKQCKLPPRQIGHDKLLAKALTNILDNAVAAGASEVATDIYETESTCHITIKNNGPAIGETKYNEIKNQAQQGFGLRFVQTILAQYGGHMAIQPSPVQIGLFIPKERLWIG